MLVVLNTKLPGQLWHTHIKDNEKRKKPKESDVFLQGGTQTLNFCHSLDYAHDNESVIYFNDLSKPIEIYTYVKKASICKLFHSKAPKIQQICH